MREADRRKLQDAFSYALEVHAEQTRKGSDAPYASHLLQVAGMVMEAGGDPAQCVAALLHDTLEDCPELNADVLAARFGEDVTALVAACTDLLPDDSPDAKSPWAARKTRFLARIRDAGPRAQLVSACDKLHNLRSLVADLRAAGTPTLERFSAEPPQIRWYFESAHTLLRGALPPALAAEFDAALDALRERIPEAAPPEPEGPSRSAVPISDRR